MTAPAPVGGLESVVAALARGHATMGHKVHVISIFDTGHVGNPLGADIPFVTTHPLEVPPRRYWRERAAVAAIVREVRADIMHTHGYRADVVDSRAASDLDIPCVSTVHGFTGGGLKNRLFERLQLRAFRRLDAVVAVSRPLVDRLAGAGVPRERIHLIPNAWTGESVAIGREDARLMLGIPAAAVAIGWVGRFTREKGADVLIRALPSLSDLALTAVMVGAGRDRAALSDEAERLGVSERVSWPGLIPDARRYLRAFDVLVLSSRTEGTPIILFEAMAAGVPVVATAVGGIPDVVPGDEARLVPPEDPKRLAAAIRLALENPGESRLRAEASRRRLDERHALAPWLAAYDALYHTIAAQGKAPR